MLKQAGNYYHAVHGVITAEWSLCKLEIFKMHSCIGIFQVDGPNPKIKWLSSLLGVSIIDFLGIRLLRIQTRPTK